LLWLKQRANCIVIFKILLIDVLTPRFDFQVH
jgi:hypothetical protein